MHNHFIQPPGHSYLEGPPRQVPGYHSLHRMVTILMAEHLTAEASVLVLGAGGGLEIKALAEAQSGWSFDGVDPSAGMLELAADTVANYQDRVRLHQGYIEDAPQGPFDGAICLCKTTRQFTTQITGCLPPVSAIIQLIDSQL